MENMVVSSMSLVSTAEFQGIAVCSDEWLPISEVNPSQLKEYLLTMKLSGYAVIGLEQTGSRY